jgi:hypothetical protein
MMANLRSLGLSLCGACAVLGCGADFSRPAPQPDCAAAAGYDLSILIDARKITGAPPTTPGYGFGDSSPGSMLNGHGPGPGIPSGLIQDVLDPTLTCGEARVVDIKSTGHNDYGSSVFIDLNGAVGTGTEGISFWARSVGSTNSAIAELSNYDTTSGKGGCVDPPTASMTAGSSTSTTTTTPGGSATNQQPNYEPPPGTCDNFFQTTVQFTSLWKLYILPYEQFAQMQQPNRIASGFDPAKLYFFAIQIQKEADFEIWIDQISAYKTVSADAGP